MQKLRLRPCQSCFSCTAEDLLKVQILPFISDINHPVRMVLPHPVNDRGKIRSIIKRGSIRLQNHARRYLLCIRLLFHIHHKGPLADISIALLFHVLHHIRYQILYIRFPFPEVKVYIKLFVVFLQIRHRYIHNVLPERMIPPPAALKSISGIHGILFVLCILL